MLVYKLASYLAGVESSEISVQGSKANEKRQAHLGILRQRCGGFPDLSVIGKGDLCLDRPQGSN